MITIIYEKLYTEAVDERSMQLQSHTGLPPNQDIQGKSGDFIFNQGKSGGNEKCVRKSRNF